MSARKLWAAGYRDLVSVIPPGAELAPTSKIKPESRGKVPGRRRSDGRWAGYPFLRFDVTEGDIQAFEDWGANIGIQGKHFPGLDIDSEAADLTKFLVQEARRFLGDAPIRTSRPPRRLLVYRTDEPFPRLRATIKYRGQDHVLELLGEGRQYLVSGQHPSGREYGWDGSPLWEWKPGDLTAITADEVEAFFRHIQEKLKGRAEVEIGASASEQAEAPPDQSTLRAPSPEALEEVVELIPNDYADRDTYIQVGYAIKAAGGDLGLFALWANKWEGDNPPETVRHDWEGMKPPYRLGYAYLQRMAEDRGAADKVAAEEFEADPDADPPSLEGSYGDAPTESDVWVLETIARRVADHIRYLPETDHFHTWGS